VPSTLDETRDIHNSTAGAPQSAAGARSLGDLSHNVYAPIGKDRDGELLFIASLEQRLGPGHLLRTRQVQAAAGQLFAQRDGIVWAALGRLRCLSPGAPQGPLDWRRGA